MSKPFNLADVKAGHPVHLTGHTTAQAFSPVKILTADLNNAWQVVISYFHGDGERVVKFLADGTNPKGEENINTRAHLVMAPIGTIDGKPVYPGDMITAYGKTFPVTYDTKIDLVDAKWPRQYPETQMNNADLSAAAIIKGVLSDVANAAIRHGIDNGYLLDPREPQAVTIDIKPPSDAELKRAFEHPPKHQNFGCVIQPWRDVERERAIMRAGILIGWGDDMDQEQNRTDEDIDKSIAKKVK